jgi:NAD(P)-dependent dehydrogenase (short-subunit alcohol dehydrogenase family)
MHQSKKREMIGADMPKSVLISGASSGIGKALSLELDRQGYQVFAGIRKTSDAEAFRSQASSLLTPVILDVTLSETISSAGREVVNKAGGELYALINNAGISIGGVLEFIPIQDFRQLMEVNLVGQLALTQACLPMLRKGRGRISFISSVSGRLATPFNGSYAASKAALISMADALRMELAPWGIPVSVLIVGSVRTPIWEKAAHNAGELFRRMPLEAWELYGKASKHAGAYYSRIGHSGMPAEAVAKIIHHQLESSHPKAYVSVGWDAIMYELLARFVPVGIRDWLVKRSIGLLNKEG